MGECRWFRVEVRTADGLVAASTSDEEGQPQDDGTVRWSLPGGLSMVATPRPETARVALAKAFVHELRSPLNALGMYLDLLSRSGNKPESGATPVQLTERSQQQIQRMDELLIACLSLTSSDDRVDLSMFLKSLVRLAGHESMRLGGSLRLSADEPLLVRAHMCAVLDALCGLLEAIWSQSVQEQVTLRVTGVAGAVRLEVDGIRLEAAPLTAPFEAAGARLESENGRLTAIFAAKDAPT
jgi:signal transduction histidine kinase